jgi:hypothetical protein
VRKRGQIYFFKETPAKPPIGTSADRVEPLIFFFAFSGAGG